MLRSQVGQVTSLFMTCCPISFRLQTAGVASTSINFFYHNFRDIIHELTQLEYPSLVGIYIEMVSSWELPATPQNLLRRTPALKYLTLGKFVPINGFSIARPLKALNLMFGYPLPTS